MATVTLRIRTLAVALGVSALIGMGARGLITSSSAPPRAAPASATTPGPRSESAAGVPTGFARSRAGAIAAAATYVRQGQRIVDLPVAERPSALQTIAAHAAAEGYVAQASAQLAELDGVALRGQGHVTWDVSVLATRLDAYTSRRARVSLWRVGVLSVAGLTSPLAEWTTVAYDLVWEQGDWKVWSETQMAGPTPMGHPDARFSTPGELLNGLGWIWDQTGARAANAVWDQIVHGLVSWVVDSMAWFVAALLQFFERSSTPSLGSSWFAGGPIGSGAHSPYGVVASLSLSVLLLCVLLSAVHGLLIGEGPAMLGRIVRDVPLSILGIVSTIGVAQVLLGAGDELAARILTGTQAGTHATTVLRSLGQLQAGSGQPTFVVFLLGLVAVVGAFFLWMELLVRSSLLYVLLALSPLAYAAFVWPLARRILHRLAELVVALIFAKVVIAITLAVAASALASSVSRGLGKGDAQIGTLLAGAIMFLLASFSPFLVLRLFPAVEAAVVAHGISRAPARATQRTMLTALTVTRLAGTGGGAPSSAGARPAGGGSAAGPRAALGSAGATRPPIPARRVAERQRLDARSSPATAPRPRPEDAGARRGLTADEAAP